MSPGDTKEFIDNGLQWINNAVPCVVTKFVQNGADEPYVNAIPSLRRKNYGDERVIEYENKEEIEEIPISYFSTQQFAITVPIAEGDRGWLVSSDFNIDEWDISGDPIADPDDASFKNFGNSCWFVPGLWPRPKGLVEYNTEAIHLRTLDDTTNITLGVDGIIELNAMTQLNLNAPIINMNGIASVLYSTSPLGLGHKPGTNQHELPKFLKLASSGSAIGSPEISHSSILKSEDTNHPRSPSAIGTVIANCCVEK